MSRGDLTKLEIAAIVFSILMFFGVAGVLIFCIQNIVIISKLQGKEYDDSRKSLIGYIIGLCLSVIVLIFFIKLYINRVEKDIEESLF